MSKISKKGRNNSDEYLLEVKKILLQYNKSLEWLENLLKESNPGTDLKENKRIFIKKEILKELEELKNELAKKRINISIPCAINYLLRSQLKELKKEKK